MADHIKAALTAAFVIFVVATTGRIDIAYSIWGLGGAASLAVMTFGTTLLTSVIGGMTTKGLNATSTNFGSKFAARGATAHRQLIYGKCRVGGTIVHMETTGVDNYLLHVVVVLAGHEIQSLESVRLNDVDLTTSSSTISGSTVYTVTNSDFSNTENDNKYDSNGRLIRYTFQDGSQTAVDGYMDAQLSSMTTSDKFLDCAYVYMQMVFDPEKFGGGMPNMSFVVKGKKVYDPRTDSTAWSENPALCVRDYLSNTTYGLKALSSEINDTTNAGGIAAAANACEVDVTLADNSSTEDKYTANGFTNFGASGQGVLEGLLSAMAGKLSYTNGQFNVFAGTTQTPSLTITDDNLLAPVNVTTNTSTGELYNTVKPVFIDAANNYVAADAPAYQDSTFLTEDTPNGVTNDKPNYVKQMEKQLPFTTTHTMAQRIGRLALKNQRQGTTISCLVDLSFMRLQPADWVYVTNERLSYSQKVFEVISINMEVIQSEEVPVLGVRLNLKETASSIYTFATSDYAAAIAQGSDVSIGGYAMAAPSGLTIGTDTLDVDAFNMTSVTVSWTNSASSLVTGTEVQYKKNAGSTYFTHSTAGKGVTSVNISGGMEMGVQYNFRIRHIGAVGTYSTYTSVVNHTVGGTPTTLAAVLNANATGVKTFLQNDVPTSVNAGDLWIDSNDNNKIYRAHAAGADQITSGEWILTTITAGAIGLGSVLNQAQVTTFAQAGTPTATAVGDLWIDTDDGNKIYRATATGTGNWVVTTLTKAGIGLGNVADERQITIFRQDGVPTATAAGDLWYDTDANNKQYRATAAGNNSIASNQWIEVTPDKTAVGLGNVDNTSDATQQAATLSAADKDDVGLGNVDNTSDATVLAATHTGVSSGNHTGTFGGVSNADMVDAKTRAFAGFDSSGNVKRTVPSAQLDLEATMTASPATSTVWTSSDGAYYSPSGTTQDVTVTYYDGTSTDECVIRWTYVAVAYSTADYILSVAEQTDSNNKFTIGSIDPASATNRKVATVVVTHTDSSETITLTCLISIVGVAGGGKS